MAQELKIGRRTVSISHPDKVLFGGSKLTKRWSGGRPTVTAGSTST